MWRCGSQAVAHASVYAHVKAKGGHFEHKLGQKFIAIYHSSIWSSSSSSSSVLPVLIPVVLKVRNFHSSWCIVVCFTFLQNFVHFYWYSQKFYDNSIQSHRVVLWTVTADPTIKITEHVHGWASCHINIKYSFTRCNRWSMLCPDVDLLNGVKTALCYCVICKQAM